MTSPTAYATATAKTPKTADDRFTRWATSPTGRQANKWVSKL